MAGMDSAAFPHTRLDSLPRRRYTDGPTPIEPLPRLSEALGGPEIWVKRDDLLGLTLGGNKTRKLEFLVADALDKDADTLITMGGVQSNHCRLTLAAARREGLDCLLLLEEDLGPDGTAVPGGPGANPPAYNGNFLLFDLLDAQVEVLANGSDLTARAEQLATELEARGKRPYIIPVGGSNVLGALGYVDCAREILAQTAELFPDHQPTWDAVITPSGSTGMQAGLVAGLHTFSGDSGNNAGHTPVVGINVSRARDAQEEKVAELVSDVTGFLGADSVPRERIIALGDYVGPGYALRTGEMVEAVRLFARTEGILLDPVYTGKTAAGLVDLIRRGEYTDGDRVLFIHSGGAPGVFARAPYFS